MKAKLHDVETCLAAAGIDASTSRRVCDAMLRGGHIVVHDEIMHAVAATASDSDGALHQVSGTGFVKLQTPLEASADQKNVALLRAVTAMARRLSVSFDPDRIISMADLDKQLAGKDVLQRLSLKQGMAALGLIA